MDLKRRAIERLREARKASATVVAEDFDLTEFWFVPAPTPVWIEMPDRVRRPFVITGAVTATIQIKSSIALA